MPALGQQAEFVFGVNEGVTYRITPHETRERYRELGDMLARIVQRPVKVVPEDNGERPLRRRHHSGRCRDE